MSKGVENKDNQKKYPLIPYIISLFIMVIAIVLVSYFAHQRNNNQQLKDSDAVPYTKIEKIADHAELY